MKIVLVGSNEPLAQSVRDFLKDRGHEVLHIYGNLSGEGEASFEEIHNGILSGWDAVINFPQKYLLDHKKGPDFYKN